MFQALRAEVCTPFIIEQSARASLLCIFTLILALLHGERDFAQGIESGTRRWGISWVILVGPMLKQVGPLLMKEGT